MRIISIDPGYDRVGVAILEKNQGKKETLIYSTCIQTKREESHSQRILSIGSTIRSYIETYNPEALVTETLFFNKNQKTAMHVAEARGVVIYEGGLKGLPVFEYTPLQVKIAITGYGRGDKNQVTAMVKNLIEIHEAITFDDEYDALAIGLTHFASYRK